jgi:hypothetical protein
MSFGNFQLHRLEPGHGQDHSQGYGFGRSVARQSQQRRDTAPAQQIQPAGESSAAFSGKSKTDLTVLTAEGDRVTISLAAQVKYAASSQTGPNGSSQSVATSTSSQLHVAVEGNLNETELKDLETLLGNLAKATSQVTSQTQSTPVADASPSDAGFSGLTSLAAFAYSYRQTVEAGTLVHSIG